MLHQTHAVPKKNLGARDRQVATRQEGTAKVDQNITLKQRVNMTWPPEVCMARQKQQKA